MFLLIKQEGCYLSNKTEILPHQRACGNRGPVHHTTITEFGFVHYFLWLHEGARLKVRSLGSHV